eukprot:c1198_g1_i1.p1 GENE.c1198_g1_i1~~c1198_g1_i1.p1  ORF type:complete len:724 (-),score=202.99 c1198_g1_i1:181-2352(-)
MGDNCQHRRANTETYNMLRALARRPCRVPPSCRVSLNQVREYEFATPRFHEALTQKLPTADRQHLKASALKYLAHFEPSKWSKDPIVTVVKGHKYQDGKKIQTTNAFGNINGSQILANAETMDVVYNHITSFTSPTDLRQAVRKAEALIFAEDVGALIGNQSLDFGKQDGLTEIEEAVQANEIERKLNDMLIKDESDEIVTIDRTPAFIGCVSNFTNFLDLSRKVLRNIEVGVPVVVLSRSNTTQHMYRWFQILVERLKQQNVDLGMVTYLSCDVQQQRELFRRVPNSPLYFTGSRPIAKAIKELLPRTYASTAGPNTMLGIGPLSERTLDAMRLSSSIENSGQCTALRHFVVAQAQPKDIEESLAKIPVVASAQDSLERGDFADLIKDAQFDLKEGYTQVKDLPAAYRISNTLPTEIDEHWRQVYVDVTTLGDFNDDDNLDNLASWLVHHQPISLAINGESAPYPIALRLFEKTALCVYTLGSDQAPALTAQARPQDGEIFGELPPRHHLHTFTRFPVTVPSSTPACNASYTSVQLLAPPRLPKPMTYCTELIQCIKNEKKRGFAMLVLNYLNEACRPRRGRGQRTSLYGLQRPPLNGMCTLIRCEPDQDLDDLLVFVLAFLVTNARTQVVISCHPSHASLRSVLLCKNRLRGIPVVFEETVTPRPVFNSVEPSLDMATLPLAGQFVSQLFCLGHVKSTKSNDDEFLDIFSHSSKWLSVVSG